MTTLFRNGQVLTPHGFERGLDVLVEDGRIATIASDIHADGAAIIDLEDGLLVPGFIDTQVNGGGDVLLNDTPTVAGVRRIAEAHRKFGTTGLMPTLISDDVPVMREALAAVRDAIAQGVPGVLGIHLEGPWLAEARKGVHDPHKFHTPDASELDLVASLDNGATMVTLGPERFAPETLHALAERGVLVCAGHTAASYEQLREAFAAGVRGVTHLFNAMTPMGSRAPGGVGAAIDDPDSWCGIIVDGHHVDDAPLRIAIAAKPRGKMMLVTDAMPPVGGEREGFTLYGIAMTCRDGKCATTEGALAGSALDMASAVRNTVQRLGLPLDEACRMASQYPAEFLRLGDELGKIAPGYRADLAWLDRDLNVRGTWIGGR
ncbi:MAG: N-acetylglucosamine-6-phosphate deacetylase [Xanthomonadales bacterium]|nr:N-acetylglucosamine-6-phosphate deacetylase [Xanthomonadales bacterium]